MWTIGEARPNSGRAAIAVGQQPPGLCRDLPTASMLRAPIQSAGSEVIALPAAEVLPDTGQSGTYTGQPTRAAAAEMSLMANCGAASSSGNRSLLDRWCFHENVFISKNTSLLSELTVGHLHDPSLMAKDNRGASTSPMAAQQPILIAHREGVRHSEIPLPDWPPAGGTAGVAEGSVGLQRACFDPYPGNPYLPSAPEDRTRSCTSVPVDDRRKRIPPRPGRLTAFAQVAAMGHSAPSAPCTA